MRNKTLVAIFLQVLLPITAGAWAENQAASGARNIVITGRKTVMVNQSSMRLGDLAEIVSPRVQDDEAVIALQKLEIDPSPSPGKDLTVTASRILERLKDQGVNLNEVVYVLPRVMTVTRASRAISLPEIEMAIKEALKLGGREIAIKRINYSEGIQVPPSVQRLTAMPMQSSKPGQMGFTIKAEVPDESTISFDVAAMIDEWIDLPTAGRSLSRGSKIQAGDVVMARLNVSGLPNDTVHKLDDVIGQEVNADIQYGEAFRKNKLNTPAAILAGSKVVMIYNSGLLEATATGIAMEAGLLGQEINIKNENSKKIVSGRVLEPGRVEVRP